MYQAARPPTVRMQSMDMETRRLCPQLESGFWFLTPIKQSVNHTAKAIDASIVTSKNKEQLTTYASEW